MIVCVDDLKLKLYDVVVTANTDFCVSGLIVVSFHDSYSSFYMITTKRLGFENDMVQYQVKLNLSSSLIRVQVRVRAKFELEPSSVLRFQIRFKLHFSSLQVTGLSRVQVQLPISHPKK